ncbi:Inner membrane protein YijD [Vibrio stylophorae]|uniref:Inner membrane protein YijD n=1 Tax=Vibrio stylophorae TaxID=659351 RepID=A0ABN8DQW1_9VIBR|nr:YijD family membrane protein [Vibrio stylophorae]CAH0532350.1 Inner membrane protein YijD [Vibrio stylophorae]
MSHQPKRETKTLLLSLLAGICGNATWFVFTSEHVAFSIFPLISLGFTLNALYQHYLEHPMEEGTPLLAAALFLVGAFGHSAFARAMNPELGSNFFAIIILLALLGWIGHRVGFFEKIMTHKDNNKPVTVEHDDAA